jgi:predicted metalloprotease with PDZ domain
VLSEVAGTDLDPLVHRLVDTTEELPLDDALAYLGLMRQPIETEELPPFHGAELSVDEGLLQVSTVLRDTPAWLAGVMPGDELVAVDGWRLHDTERLDALPAGPHTWTVSRRGRLQELLVTSEAPSPEPYELVVDPSASLTAQRMRRDWLGGN